MTDRELLELIAGKVASLELIAEKVNSLETGFSEMKGDITKMKRDIAETKGDITEMKMDIAETKGDITEMKMDIAETKGDITEMKKNIAETKGDITEMKVDIKDLKQKQEIIIEQTAGLTEFRTSASKVFSGHNDSIEFLKARQTALEEEVFRLKKKIS